MFHIKSKCVIVSKLYKIFMKWISYYISVIFFAISIFSVKSNHVCKTFVNIFCTNCNISSNWRKNTGTVWKSSTKSDHDDFFPSNHFTKIGEFWFSQMHVFIYLGGISTSNWWNISCREGFEVKFIHNEVFKPLNINMSIFLPKMGYFQKHITSSSVHLRQVFQHWKIGWTLFFQL